MEFRASSYPSGDGSEGGDFVFAFNVLPADVNGDGVVNSQDIALTSSNWLKSAPAGDLNADGIVNVQDLALLTANWLTTLPVNSGALGIGRRFRKCERHAIERRSSDYVDS